MKRTTDTVWVVYRWFGDCNTEADVLKVCDDRAAAIQFAHDYHKWDPDLCETDDLFWGHEEFSVQITEEGVERDRSTVFQFDGDGIEPQALLDWWRERGAEDFSEWLWRAQADKVELDYLDDGTPVLKCQDD